MMIHGMSGISPVNFDPKSFWVDPYKTAPWDTMPTVPYMPTSKRVGYTQYVASPLSSTNLDVNVIVDGQEIDKIYAKNNVWFVSPHPSESQPYIIRIKNKSSRKITVEVTVDGLSVMNGQVGNSGDGYIINAHDSIDIKGWRRGMDAVAQFVFTNENSSYAGLTRRPKDIGTITVTAFAEYEEPKITYGAVTLNSINKATATDWSCCTTNCLKSGTGYGEEVQDSVVSAKFKKDIMSKIVLVYKYDHKEALSQSGVIPFCPPPEETVTTICPTSRW